MAKTDKDTKTSKKTVKKAVTPKDKIEKKTAVAKTTVTKAAPKKKAAKKPAPTKNSGNNNTRIRVTHEQRHRMICEAAYYISLERTHITVNPTEDWLRAESSIDQICVLHDK